MAKKNKKSASSRADAVRKAVDHAFTSATEQAEQAQQLTRDRAQEIADDLTQLASRFRDAIEDLRPPTGEELRSIASRLDALEARLAKIEKPAARKPAARKPAARKPAARKPAARKPAARKTSS
jgi:DNA-directed RNA polymerase subunit F